MRVFGVMAGLSLLIAGAIALAGDKTKADALFAKRDDPSSLEAAIAEYEKAGDLTQAMRGCFVRLEIHDDLPTAEQKLAWIERGLGHGAKIFGTEKVYDQLERVPKEKADALYWYAQLYGLRVQHAWKIKQAFMAGNFRRMGERAIELDETVNYGGPLRMLGNFLADAPGFMGGDPAKAAELLERAVQVGPGYFDNRVLRAELVHAKINKDREAFRRDLSFVIRASEDVLLDRIPEQRKVQAFAKKLLARENEFF